MLRILFIFMLILFSELDLNYRSSLSSLHNKKEYYYYILVVWIKNYVLNIKRVKLKLFVSYLDFLLLDMGINFHPIAIFIQ